MTAPTSPCHPSTIDALRLLQASSCFRGEVCSSLPCACAEALAKNLAAQPAGNDRGVREALTLAREYISQDHANFADGTGDREQTGEILEKIAAALAPQAREAGEPCDCGFSAQVCKTNPCMRKKMATSGLNPGAKYPYCGADASPAPIPDAPVGREEMAAAILARRYPYRTDRQEWIDAFLQNRSAGQVGSFYFAARDAFADVDAIRALKPRDGGSTVANEDISTNPAPRLHAFKPQDGGK
jgi:hypothetical protein